MTKTIIFDFGGVLVKDCVEAFEQKFDEDRLPKKQQAEYEGLIKQCELGKISRQTLFSQMGKIYNTGMTGKQIETWLLSHTKILPPVKLAKKLQDNYQVLILSNNFKSWHSKMMKELDLSFPGCPFINSANIGGRKQNGAAFRYAIKKYKLSPRACVFIDDHAYNLPYANKIGMHTYLYNQDYSKLIRYLKHLDVQL